MATGVEFAVPLERLGDYKPGDEVRVVALLGNQVLDYFSNQILPPLANPQGNLESVTFDFGALGIGYASHFIEDGTPTNAGFYAALTSNAPSPHFGDSIPVTVRFSATPEAGSFVDSDVETANASIVDFRQQSPTTWTFHLVPSSPSASIEARLPAGTVTNESGVANQESPLFLRQVESSGSAWMFY